MNERVLNPEGLTWEEWSAAAKIDGPRVDSAPRDDIPEALGDWIDGVDPAEWAAYRPHPDRT